MTYYLLGPVFYPKIKEDEKELMVFCVGTIGLGLTPSKSHTDENYWGVLT